MKDADVKMTTTIPAELRDKIKGTLYYGQLTNFLRNVIECLADLIDEKRMVEVTKFIHKEGSITLTPRRLKNAAHGQDKG